MKKLKVEKWTIKFSWFYESDYEKCLDDLDYCSNYENNQKVCRFRFSNHPKMAAAMLTPFLVNYFLCFITFLRKETNKKYFFIFPLLNLYPQFGNVQSLSEVVGVILLLFYEHVGLLETCLESVPSVFIMIIIWSYAGGLERERRNTIFGIN